MYVRMFAFESTCMLPGNNRSVCVLVLALMRVDVYLFICIKTEYFCLIFNRAVNTLTVQQAKSSKIIFKAELRKVISK